MVVRVVARQWEQLATQQALPEAQQHKLHQQAARVTATMAARVGAEPGPFTKAVAVAVQVQQVATLHKTTPMVVAKAVTELSFQYLGAQPITVAAVVVLGITRDQVVD